MKARTPLLSLASSAVLLALAGQAHAAGFQLVEHSAAGLGSAYAGEAAMARDASVIARNPAAMSALNAPMISLPTMNISPDIKVSGAATTDGIAPSALLPTFYAVYPVSDRLAFGVGGFSNFGIHTEYGSEFEFSNLADETEIITYNINPSVSWKLNDMVSIGGGLNYVIAEATISSTAPGTGANVFELSGDDTAFGWNFGLLVQPSPATQIGISYRSVIDLDLEGKGSSQVYVGVPIEGVNDLGLNFNSAGSVDLKLPNILELAINHSLNDWVALHASAQYTGWSSFQELAPVLENGDHQAKLGDVVVGEPLKSEQNWDDVWRLAVGASWQALPGLQLRVGTAYDQTPTNDEYRTLRTPDNDRIWASIGASWQATRSLSIDAGYSHLFADKAKIVEHGETFEVDPTVNIVGVQANWVF